MADRNSIIDKIKALLAKTTENGCTEEEELAALAKARAWIDTLRDSDDELQLSREEKAILHDESEADARDTHQIKWHLGMPLAAIVTCEFIVTAPRLDLPSPVSNRTSILRHGCSIT